MMRPIIIFVFCLVTSGSFAQTDTLFKAVENDSAALMVRDDSTIDAVISNDVQPDKQKVEHISQLTRYGFKNLFTKFGYNPALPYTSQINPNAELYMQDYLRHHRNSLIRMKSWGVPYFNLIDNIFLQYGLPKELKYLAVIESNLKTSATSWVGAGGPWQFMPYTARQFGLRVNSDIDERRDYFKSTHAAARYLLQLYKQMPDWLLVIAAYNGGPGRVYEAIRKSGSRDFWRLQYYLPEESRNHVKKFIATHYVMEAGPGTSLNPNGTYAPTAGGNPYEQKHQLTAAELAETETQTISGKFRAGIIAKNISMSMDSFNRYNPQLDERLMQNGQADLILPAEKMQLFLSTKYQILNECVNLLLGDAEIPNQKKVYKTAPKKKARKR